MMAQQVSRTGEMLRVVFVFAGKMQVLQLQECGEMVAQYISLTW
jgi:hypothetical protein